MHTANNVAALAADQAAAAEESLRVVITGHVDHGKSTVIGRLLADTGSLPEGKLDQLRKYCERNAKPFEYAFLLDALKDERAQGITIDAARVFFKTARRRYIVVDAPGHIEFLKNMVTGASRAEAALVVIDAKEGVRENSRRHGYLLSMLGIRQIIVLVNKMDLVGYERGVFDHVASEYVQFLEQVGIRPLHVIPVAAHPGDNIVTPGDNLLWYRGPTVLGALDELRAEALPREAPLRMPVQGVYKFTELDDNRRIIAGTIETGTLRVGDAIEFYPSGKRTTVASIEGFNRALATQAAAGDATGFTMSEQVYVARGEIVTRADQATPQVTTRFRANIFWLGKAPMTTKKEYLLKLGTARVAARLQAIERLIDASKLEPIDGEQQIERHQVAECVIEVTRPLAFDTTDELITTSRFVVVDDYEIAGGGLIRDALQDSQTPIRDRVMKRNAQWDASRVSEGRRAERYSQRPVLILITGDESTDRKGLARECEMRLFDEGRFVYFLGMGNVVHGVDADIAGVGGARPEHLRRLGEVANILLDAGLIVVAAAANLATAEIDTLRTAIGDDRLHTVWVGERRATDVATDLQLPADESPDRFERIKALLQQRGTIFRPLDTWRAR
jgi:bifunctional enzyme CysN/CysC